MSVYPEAIWEQGPDFKYYDAPNAVFGVVCHSMEGWMAGARSRLHGTGPLNQASWHFSILKDGTVFQHYPLEASCWHAGNFSANSQLVGIEHEGRAGEPFTEEQVESSVRLVKWIAEWAGWAPERRKTLWEHNEVCQWATPNAGPTACPSNRVPWERYEEESVEVRALSQSEAIEAVKKTAQAVGPDYGQWYEVTGGYTPKPGRKVFLVEVEG